MSSLELSRARGTLRAARWCPWTRWRLGTKIALLLALSVAVPLGVAAAFTYALGRGIVQARTEALLASRADELVNELDGFNRWYLGTARRLARDPAAGRVLSGADGRTRRELRAHLAGLSDSDDAILAAELIGATGGVALSSSPALDGIDVSFRRFVQEALGGKTVVSDPFLALPVANDVPCVAYAEPVFGRGGRVLGAAVVLVRTSALWNAVRTGNERAGTGSFSLLVDSAGIRLAHSKRDDFLFRPAGPLAPAVIDDLVRQQRFGRTTLELARAVVPAPAVMRIATGAERPSDGSFRLVSPYSGQLNVAVARRLSTVGWTLFHVVPLTTIEAPVRELGIAVVPALVAGALVIVASLLAARRALRPATELAAAVDAVARGETARATVNGSDELAHLARRFNEMAAAIESSRTGLEVRVRERTQALSAANAELVAHREELDRQRVALERKNEEVLRADRLKSEFLANMSHELRTPLHAIIGFSDLLAEQVGARLTAVEQRYLGDVRASGTHLLALINDILDLSKIEAGQVTLEVAEVAPLAAIAEVTELLVPTARARGITVRVLGASVPAVLADPRRLRQILLNLLSNALKFSPEGSHIDVAAVAQDGHVRLSVRDQGPGVDDALRARLFRPFVQGESPLVKRHHGTGLGLAICRRLVEMHGGTIGVESTPGEGAAFHFTMPVAQPAAEARSRDAAAPALPTERPERARNGDAIPADGSGAASVVTTGTAVIIDDNEPSRDLARALLERRGWRVLVADGGQPGIDLVRSARPSLVMCDLAMPGTDGLSVARALKSDPATISIALVALTALAMATDEEHARAAGFDAFLTKPLDRDVLDAVLARLPARSAAAERAA